MPLNPELVHLDQIYQAREIISAKVHRTPLMGSTYLSEATNTHLSLKLELFQKTGSFKVRGVTNKMNSLTDVEKRNGVISLSAGNHAQAVAWGAAQYGIPATLIMPANSVPAKQAATRGYGAEVLLTDGHLLDYCLQIQKERDLYLVHPFDDPKIIAGHGTIGLEIVEDVPEVEYVIVGIGGGGLMSGISAAVKQLKPDVTVIGVEPEGATTMTQSLAKGEPVYLDSVNTIADGLAAPFVGKHNLRHVQEFVDDIVIVSDDEIRSAMRDVWARCKVVAEPAACASVAALLSEKVKLPAGANVVCMVSGGNVNWDVLGSLLGG
jgi:threonine dehydratase